MYFFLLFIIIFIFYIYIDLFLFAIYLFIYFFFILEASSTKTPPKKLLSGLTSVNATPAVTAPSQLLTKP